MTDKLDELSVFFPAYNEEANIKDTVTNAVKIAPTIAKKWEIVIVNDGSKDNTLKIAQNLAKETEGVRVEDHRVNRGYGAALKTGFYKTKYDWIAFTDSDGQFDFSEIANFIEKQRETKADIVVGYYKKRQVSKGKVLTSKMWEYLVYLMFGLKVKDIDCGFKLISRKVLDKISRLESERGAFISSEFLIKAKKKGFKIVEIPVTHHPRIEGAGTGRDLGVILSSFTDLIRLWRKLR